MTAPEARSIVEGSAAGPVVATAEGLSFWGGVDPASGRVIDVHHPLAGTCVSGTILTMPTSRGSCSGSGVLLDLILAGRAPAALVFREAEDVLTLGALVGAGMFGRPLPVLRLGEGAFAALAGAKSARIGPEAIEAEGLSIPVSPPSAEGLALSPSDRAMLDGAQGEAARAAMRIVCAMARQQGATRLLDVTRVHIDGCIHAGPANLVFAGKMAGMGARVRVATTMNAISVDHANWRAQGVDPGFGEPAARLADAYVRMGCRPTFTCAPYLLAGAPRAGEAIAWAESNAVVFANSVLGAHTPKHPDFLDLCIALTGRAPLAGVYLEENRKAGMVLDFALPGAVDDAFWPLAGYVAGKAAPDRIPLLAGLSPARPSRDDLKALCAAFGTTSAAPMLHVEGVTPEAGGAAAPGTRRLAVSAADMAAAWDELNAGPETIELVAIGSPHASLQECRAFAAALGGRRRHENVAVIVTAGRDTIAAAREDGTLARLEAGGVQVIPDLCWCSIPEPVFPVATRAVMTNSGKYAHYGPGLCGRPVRLGSLADCALAAATGRVPARRPSWLS